MRQDVLVEHKVKSYVVPNGIFLERRKFVFKDGVRPQSLFVQKVRLNTPGSFVRSRNPLESACVCGMTGMLY